MLEAHIYERVPRQTVTKGWQDLRPGTAVHHPNLHLAAHQLWHRTTGHSSDSLWMRFECLQRQMEFFARDMDALEMRGRRKMLLIHGVPEDKAENTALVVTNMVQDKLQMNTITGKSSPRPILVKVQDVDTRDKVWHSKTKLKGTGITISEFLTKTRHQVFMAARNKFGVTKCWTNAGHIYVLGPDGVRHRIVSHSELRAIGEPAAVPERSTAAVSEQSPAAVARRGKRGVNKK
ncbi:hypothetical protein SFRURICE_021285 [Spodoptera frugiperda]|nr:hypothetical protein SFRURICE_021285 [Spodoptera frugiperda]